MIWASHGLPKSLILKGVAFGDMMGCTVSCIAIEVSLFIHSAPRLIVFYNMLRDHPPTEIKTKGRYKSISSHLRSFEWYVVRGLKPRK